MKLRVTDRSSQQNHIRAQILHHTGLPRSYRLMIHVGFCCAITWLWPQCEINRLPLPFEQQENRLILGKT
jgi:hypothetical protein